MLFLVPKCKNAFVSMQAILANATVDRIWGQNSSSFFVGFLAYLLGIWIYKYCNLQELMDKLLYVILNTHSLCDL